MRNSRSSGQTGCRSFKRLLLIGIAISSISLSGQSAAAIVNQSGLLDMTNDIQYFDSAMGTLNSVEVEYLFHADTSYSASCATTLPTQDTCTAAISGANSHGVVDGPLDVLNPVPAPFFDTRTENVNDGEFTFDGSFDSTFSGSQLFTGLETLAFVGSGLFGFNPFADAQCVQDSAETFAVTCDTAYTSVPNVGSYKVTYDFSRPSAVPVPAAVWLFGTALIGLVGFGKRKKAARNL